jgi:type IV secretion system protein VirB8
MMFGRRNAVDRTAYYAGADTWATDMEARRAASTRLAWRIAAGAGAVAVLEAVALVLLMPLKTVVPYTVTVDRQSGYVETVRGVKLGALSESEAVTQAFLAQYVMARETFDAADLNAGYQRVAAWSTGTARASWLRAYDRSNPEGVLNRIPPTTVIATRIKSISMLGPQSALVRFETLRQDGGQAEPQAPIDWSSVVSFRYNGAPMRMEDRLTNPLGFQVTAYRRDAERAGDQPYVQRTAP